MHSGFEWGDPRERANLEDLGIDRMKFESEDLHCLYSLRNVVGKMSEYMARMNEKRNAYKIFVENNPFFSVHCILSPSLNLHLL